MSNEVPHRLLVTAFDYRPKLGGVATCAYELASTLSRTPGITLRLLAPAQSGDRDFDAAAPFETVRIKLPKSAIGTILPLSLHLRAEIARFKPDAVINLLWHPCGVATLLSNSSRLFGPRPPYFVITHGVELMESTRNWRKQLRGGLAFVKRSVLRNAAGILAVSRYTARLAQDEARMGPETTVVCHNGVDTDRFKPAPKSAELARKYKLEDRFVFLTVSRLVPNKGIDQALRALALLKTEANIAYLIAGTGPDLPRLQRLTRELGLGEIVIFCGAVAPERLPEYYNTADCFVLLSREDKLAPSVEGFGIVFLEAAACGKPAIAGNSGGIPDAVADQRTGWLTDPKDPRAVADAMLACVRSPGKTAQIGAAARDRVLNGFTWQHVANRVLDGIKTRLESQGGNP